MSELFFWNNPAPATAPPTPERDTLGFALPESSRHPEVATSFGIAGLPDEKTRSRTYSNQRLYTSAGSLRWQRAFWRRVAAMYFLYVCALQPDTWRKKLPLPVRRHIVYLSR